VLSALAIAALCCCPRQRLLLEGFHSIFHVNGFQALIAFLATLAQPPLNFQLTPGGSITFSSAFKGR
jgi:hypothetical protein